MDLVDEYDCEEYDKDDREEDEEGDSEEYEEHVRDDLRRRVLVDYEVFMKYVLHVPEDWETKWRPALDAVKADANFKKCHESYSDCMVETGLSSRRTSTHP